VICLVSRSLRSIAPSQKPARFVRIQHLPQGRNPLFLRDSAASETRFLSLSCSPRRIDGAPHLSSTSGIKMGVHGERVRGVFVA
jgi:hypothetical protein